MANLSIPVASATQGATNDMPDVIDSLKRLERIGSEQSKTVQKILDAARELEKMIVEQYGQASLPRRLEGLSSLRGFLPFGDEEMSRRRDNELAQQLGVELECTRFMRYEFAWEPGDSPTIRSLEHRTRRVSEDREAALRFSRDIANGLLALIEYDLEQLQAENTFALQILGAAKTEIGQKRNPPSLDKATEDAIKRTGQIRQK